MAVLANPPTSPSNMVYVIDILQPDKTKIKVVAKLDALTFIIRDLKTKAKGEVLFPMETKERSLVENSKVTLAAKVSHPSTCVCKECVAKRQLQNTPVKTNIAHAEFCKCTVCTLLQSKEEPIKHVITCNCAVCIETAKEKQKSTVLLSASERNKEGEHSITCICDPCGIKWQEIAPKGLPGHANTCPCRGCADAKRKG